MSSNWQRIVALVAVVMLGWFVVSQSGGQEPDPFREVAPPRNDLFSETVPKPNTTVLAIPNAVGAPRVQWEYQVLSGNAFDEADADKSGIEGWELVTIYRQNDADIRAVFKRPKQMKLSE